MRHVRIVGFFCYSVTRMSRRSHLSPFYVCWTLSLPNINSSFTFLYFLFTSWNCCHNCHLIYTIASICNLCIDYLPNASHEQTVMIIIYTITLYWNLSQHCNDQLSKAQPPPFNDTYLNAPISSFYHFLFIDLSSVDDFYNILFFVVMIDMKVSKQKK